MTPVPSLIGLFVEPLNPSSIDYMVTGGLASVIYGHPRLTLDIDLVIRLEPSMAAEFSRLWSAAEFYVPPVEVIVEESARPEHGHFNVTRMSGWTRVSSSQEMSARTGNSASNSPSGSR